MNALYQRLRDLEPKTFEDLCFQIISARHPGANVTRVGDSGGDKGIDFFQGNLVDGPTIWQCKFFKNGIRSPQKTQIKHSLRTGIQHFHPKRWILCVPIDLNANAHTWFQQLRKEYQGRVDLGLFQASQIVRELLHRREIRNLFFPGAVLEPDELRSILTGTGNYTNRELEKLTLENVHQYLQRLSNQDARFDYQVIFVPHSAQTSSRSPLPGLIARITDNDKQIDVFARDIEALRLDPPKIHFTVKGAGVKKLRDALTHGTTVELDSQEFSNIHSSFDFLLSSKLDPQHQRLTLQPHTTQSRPLDLRVILGSNGSAVSYDRIRFMARMRMANGTRRIELAADDDNLPFRMSINFPFSEMGNTPHEADISFSARFTGKEVHDVRKFVYAMMALKENGDVEVWDIRHGKPFFKSRMTFEEFPYANKSLLSLLNDVCEISDVYKVDIRFPESVSQEDNDNINLLLTLAREGSAGAEVTGISCTLTKSAEHERALLESLGREMVFQFRVDRMSPQPSVFGTSIDTGPCLILAEHAVVADEQRVRNDYISAKEGEGVVVRFNLLKPARVFRETSTAAT